MSVAVVEAGDTMQFRLLDRDDRALLEGTGAGVFDHAVRPELAREFLDDPRHHLAVAIDEGAIVAFASGVHYVHPDKAAELFINEVGVAEGYRRRGIARQLIDLLLDRARELGCREAWVATEPENRAARALYASAGGREDRAPFVVYSFPLEEPADG